MMMVLAFRRQSSSCGVNVLPVSACSIWNTQKKELPGSPALRSKYLSAFFYPFECGKWTDAVLNPAGSCAFWSFLLHSPAWVLQQAALDPFPMLLESCREPSSQCSTPAASFSGSGEVDSP